MLSAIIASAETMKYLRKSGWRSAAKETFADACCFFSCCVADKANLAAALECGKAFERPRLNGNRTAGLVVALIGALALAGKFVPAFLSASDKGAALWPAGVFAVLGVTIAVWTGLALANRA